MLSSNWLVLKANLTYLHQVTFFLLYAHVVTLGFPGGTSGKVPACQCRGPKRHGFNPCVGKIPWRSAWQLPCILAWRIPWTEEPGGLQSKGSQSWTRLKRLSMHTHVYFKEIFWCLDLKKSVFKKFSINSL